MRTTLKLTMITALALLTLQSCEKEFHSETNSGRRITASIEQPQMTRTDIGAKEGNQAPIVWLAGNTIKVYSDAAGASFKLVSGEGTDKGTFELQYGEFNDVIQEAFYPSYGFDPKTGIYKFNEIQPYDKEHQIKDNFLPMYAKADGNSLIFKPLCGILQLQLTGDPDTRIQTIKLISEDKLSGEATLNRETMELTFAADASNEILLKCDVTGIELSSEPKAFNFIVPATKSEKFTIIITDIDGNRMIKTTQASKSNIFQRAKIKVMPPVKFAGEAIVYSEGGKKLGTGIRAGFNTWAPVNCGYEAPSGADKGYPYGKLYQWGRKDGLGYDDTDQTHPAAANLLPALAFGAVPAAGNFYKGDAESHFQWMKGQTAEEGAFDVVTEWQDLKKADSPHKDNAGIGNPCPEGWRVPTRTEINDLKRQKSAWTTHNGQNGYWFSGFAVYENSNEKNRVFLPAGGYIETDGVAQQRSTHGNYWTSSPYKSKQSVYWFSFNETKVAAATGNNGYHAKAMNIRCVLDE